jgi:hypothetical protein
VWYNGDVVCCGHCGDLDELGHTTNPHDVGLENVQVAALNQLPEAVSRVLVLASGELHPGVSALDLLKTIRVIG